MARTKYIARGLWIDDVVPIFAAIGKPLGYPGLGRPFGSFCLSMPMFYVRPLRPFGLLIWGHVPQTVSRILSPYIRHSVGQVFPQRPRPDCDKPLKSGRNP